MTTTRGIRKVNENILSQGRAIIVTEKDKNKYKWSEIPVGSKFIDTTTGVEMVKLEGATDWVPSGIKNDGTINIAKDTKLNVESFIIKQLNVPGTKREFQYYYETKDAAHVRHGIILYQNEVGACGEYNQYGTYPTWAECKRCLLISDNSLEQKYKNTKKVGYVFSLERGDYSPMRNHLEVVIDDLLHRTANSGGVKEISETRFCLTEENLEDGMEVTAKYVYAFRLGNPYPRHFMTPNQPDRGVAEIGDIWFDIDGQIGDEDPLTDYVEADGMIGWDRIRPSTRPKTLAGYGITDKVSYQGHKHSKSDIVDFPTNFKANGGRADSATKADRADRATVADKATKADSATMADAAGKATNDGAGRNIVNTYVEKTALTPINNRLNSNEFVKNETTNKKLSLKYENEGGKNVITSYVDGVKVPFSLGDANKRMDEFSDKGGYYIMPNGLILQWGREFLVQKATWTEVKFPIKFPNKLLTITNAPVGGNVPTTWEHAGVLLANEENDDDERNREYFRWYCEDGFRLFWMAIGY